MINRTRSMPGQSGYETSVTAVAAHSLPSYTCAMVPRVPVTATILVDAAAY